MTDKKVFLSFDLAGAEWVIVAYLTGDKNMLSVVQEGKSPHTVTASLMFNVPEEVILAEEKALEGSTDPAEIRAYREAQGFAGAPMPAAKTGRQGGKECNFSLNYDVGPVEFSRRTLNPLPESKRLIRLYRTVAYPGLPPWHRHTQKLIRRDGCLTNCFGRRRDFYKKPGDDMYRVGYAFKPQSTVYDVTRVAMQRIYHDEPEIELMMQVHDEIVMQAPCDPVFIAEAVPRIRQHLTVPLCYADPNGIEREFTLGMDGKLGFCKNKRFMTGLSEEPSADDVRTAIAKAGEAVGWGSAVNAHLSALSIA